MKPEGPVVLLLMGPTACGKTALAMKLSDRLATRKPVHLINMDSAQVYRQLNIGSAKPSASELAEYPHALIDIRDPAEPYSAAEFVADADAQIGRALAEEKLPVLVGGTMLYARAFSEGLADLPRADPVLRAQIEDRAAQLGWPALHAELAQRDPAAAARIHPNNHQRLQRALEVLAVTGSPMSELWQSHGARGASERLGVQLLPLALIPADRSLLHARIEDRFARMLAQGLIEEVRMLYERGDLHPGLPALRSVGYRQVWQFLEGALDHKELLAQGTAATRQLAKRQLTWLRSWPNLTELPADPLLAATERDLEQHLEKLSDDILDALSSRLAK